MLFMISMLSFYNTRSQNKGIHGDVQGVQDDLDLLHSEHLAQSSEVVVLCRPYCWEKDF